MGFFAALRFLTIIPTPRWGRLEDSLPYFPIVGMILGGIVGGFDLLLTPYLPSFPRSALAVLLLCLFTGALHLDGLADTCDGLVLGKDRQDRLRIMRDSRVGSFGAIGIFTILILKVATLSALPSGERLLALILTPMLGRWAMNLNIHLFPYARPEGMGAAFKRASSPIRLTIATLISIDTALFLLGLGDGSLLLGISLAAALLLGLFLSRHLGGLTGDSYGAISELVEATALLAFLSIS